MYPQSVPALISKNVGNTLTNYNTWNGIMANVLSYGAKGDGVTDDTVAIQSAINSGLPVYFPITTKNEYKITSTLVNPTGKAIIMLGQGSMVDSNNIDDAPYKPLTKLLWGGNASIMVKITGPIGSTTIKGITLDGAGIATYGINLDTVQYSNFEDLGFQSFATAGLWMNTAAGAILAPADPNVNCMFNSFKKLQFQYAPKAIVMDGNATNGSNTCHNTFENIIVAGYTGAAAIHYVKTDNNTINELYTYRTSGAGYGIQIEATAGPEYVFHFQGQANGVAGNAGLLIVGYDRSNGQLAPVGSNIEWTETGANSQLWHINNILEQPTIDKTLTVKGRTIQQSYMTTAAMAATGTAVLSPSGAPSSITNLVAPLDYYPVAMSISLSSFITAGTITINIKDNGTVVWSNVVTYPTGNNQFFTFSQSTPTNKVSKGHGITVEVVTSGIAPTTLQAYVSTIFAI